MRIHGNMVHIWTDFLNVTMLNNKKHTELSVEGELLIRLRKQWSSSFLITVTAAKKGIML